MELTETELRRQRIRAAYKDAHAVIARDFSASRMNATKWREVVEAIGEDNNRYRFRWVNVSKVSDWMNAWIPFPASTYFDTAAVGPFKTSTIEWMEIDPVEVVPGEGLLLKPQHINHAAEIERRLEEINVPYEWVDGYIRIVGYVRNSS